VSTTSNTNGNNQAGLMRPRLGSLHLAQLLHLKVAVQPGREVKGD